LRSNVGSGSAATTRIDRAPTRLIMNRETKEWKWLN
jgi:hypothetical protein